MFSTRYPVFFSPNLCRLNCGLLYDLSQIIMCAKDKKSDVFSYFKKAKGECLARSHTVSAVNGLLNTAWHLCSCKYVHVRKNT